MARFQRSRYIVKLGLQMRYMGVVLLALLLVSMVVGWTVWFTIWKQICDPALTNEQLIDIFARGNEILLWKMLVAIVFICFVSIFVSHKIAGPVYRFEESAKTIANGDFSLRIRLRKSDELHDLADAFNRMSESLESIVKDNNAIMHRLTAVIEKARTEFQKETLPAVRKQELLEELHMVQAELKRLADSFTVHVGEDELPEDVVRAAELAAEGAGKPADPPEDKG